MIKNKIYDKYKPSGVEWLGRVPEHWEVDRLRWTVFGCKNGIWGNEPDGVDDLVCVRVADFDRTKFRVMIDEPTVRAVTHSERRGRLLQQGDLLLEKSGGGELQPVGAVMLFEHDTDAVCSNFVARMLVSNGFDPIFLTYLHAHLYVRRVNTRSIKQTTGIQNLDSMAYLDERVACPPLTEQRTIADFLDRRTGKIDELIAKKERVIELLSEKRTALISHAVTKGLNPDAKMKDSRIDWLGEVPEHWEVKKGKYLFAILSGFAPEQFDFSDAANSIYLRVDDLNNEENGLYLKEGKARFILRDIPLYDKNIILFPKRGAAILTNKVKILGIKCLFDTNLMGLSVFKGKASIEYLSYCILSRRLGDIADTSTIPQINNKHIYPLCFPCPSLEEQSEIVSFLDRETSKIDALIAKVTDAIEKLKEYRTALISAAVTGKIDVRKEV